MILVEHILKVFHMFFILIKKSIVFFKCLLALSLKLVISLKFAED